MKNMPPKDTNSEEYLKSVSDIYHLFEELYNKIQDYPMTESLFFIKIAMKCFEDEISKELNHNS